VTEEYGRQISQAWRLNVGWLCRNLQFVMHGLELPGEKKVLKDEAGKYFLIFEIRFWGTYSMSPGLSSRSSSRFRDDNIALWEFPQTNAASLRFVSCRCCRS
jgi:hypothetical protein